MKIHDNSLRRCYAPHALLCGFPDHHGNVTDDRERITCKECLKRGRGR